MSSSGPAFTQKGIAAVKAGNAHLAKKMLEAALAENPNDAQAWLWMSAVVQTPDEKRECLRRVLAIDPNHAAAKRGLEQLGPEPMRPLVVEPAPAAPTPPATAQPSRARTTGRPSFDEMRNAPASRPQRRSRAVPIVLALVVIGALAVVAVVVISNNAQQSASSALPRGTPVIPPTWTPEPSATPRPTPTPRPAPTQLRPLVEEAIRLRELEPSESIHFVLSADFDLDLYLRNDLDAQSVVFANTFWEEMRALGLVSYEAQFDRQQLIDATSQQLGGFYSSEDKTLYAVTRSSRVEPGEYAVIVHEYVHALTDMHFDLTRLFRLDEATTDGDLASRALAEGDATLVENLSPWGYYGEQDWEQYAADARWAAPLFRQSGVSPALIYIQSFPYAEGWRFVWTLRDDGGWEAVNTAYDNLPASTEQILHPAKYIAGDDAPREVALPDIAAPSLADYELVVEQDTLGEFVLRLLLADFLEDETQAEPAAAGWGGDALRVWRDGVGRQSYVLLTVWDTEDDALEFHNAAAEMLAVRVDGERPDEIDRGASAFDGEAGSAYLNRVIDQVLVIWSPDAELRDEIRAAFPDF
jgi:hypothetical protein